MMKFSSISRGILAFLAAGMILISPGVLAAQKPAVLKIGVVNFLTGPGAVAGIPGKRGGELVADQINRAGGIDGVPIRLIWRDESGGVAHAISVYKSLIETNGVSAVIGYISSADCLAIDPIAEHMQIPTIAYACMTTSVPLPHARYFFRTAPTTVTDALAVAAYTLKMYPGVHTIAGLNENYAFGHDEWTQFVTAMKVLKPGIRVVGALWPQLFHNVYGAEISRILALHPDVLYVSFWGGDLTAFIEQARARGLFQSTHVALSGAGWGGVEGLRHLPAGVIGGGGETGYLRHPGRIASARVAAFNRAYKQRFHEPVINGYPYDMQRALYAVRDAYLRAIREHHGRWPTPSAVAAALVGLPVPQALPAPTRIRRDHQAELGMQVGKSVRIPNRPLAVFNKIIYFPPALVMPPVGTHAESWLKTLTPAMLKKIPRPVIYH